MDLILEAHEEGDPPSSAEEFGKHAKETLGITQDFETAGFILPNGSLVNCAPPASKKNMRGYTFQRMSHKQSIMEIYGEDAPSVEHVLELGIIRIAPESGAIEIHKAPTASQLQKVVEFAKEVGAKFDIVLDLRMGTKRFNEMYARPIESRVISEDIVKFYASKSMHRSLVSQFHVSEQKKGHKSLVMEAVIKLVKNDDPARENVLKAINEIAKSGYWFEKFIFLPEISCLLELGIGFQNELWIKSILSTETKQGNATKAMKIIHDVCDKLGVKTTLYPKAFGTVKDKMTTAQLKRWYKKLGYIDSKDGQGNMHREPNKTID